MENIGKIKYIDYTALDSQKKIVKYFKTGGGYKVKVGLKTFGEKIIITLNIINITGGSTSLHFSLGHLITRLSLSLKYFMIFSFLNGEAGTWINNDSIS